MLKLCQNQNVIVNQQQNADVRKKVKHKNIIAIFMTITAIICLSLVATAVASNSNKIHIISENAVYIENESCTINMNAERPAAKIDEDMFNCALMHYALKQ
jgi:hypothetical protein